MSQTLDKVRHLTLVQAGFRNSNGDNRPGLLDSDSAARQIDTSLRYSNLFNEIAADAPGNDLIYESPHADRSLEPHALTSKPFPILLRVRYPPSGRKSGTMGVSLRYGSSPNRAFAYTTLSHVPKAKTPPRHLLGEFAAIRGHLQGMHEFRRQHFDDGSFWHAGVGRQIDASDRVDQSLLHDLARYRKPPQAARSSAFCRPWPAPSNRLYQVPRRQRYPYRRTLPATRVRR